MKMTESIGSLTLRKIAVWQIGETLTQIYISMRNTITQGPMSNGCCDLVTNVSIFHRKNIKKPYSRQNNVENQTRKCDLPSLDIFLRKGLFIIFLIGERRFKDEVLSVIVWL